jgi:hypothetical protein
MARFTLGFLNTVISITSPSSNLRNLAFTNSLPLSFRTASGLLPLPLANIDRKAEATSSPVLKGIGIV